MEENRGHASRNLVGGKTLPVYITAVHGILFWEPTGKQVKGKGKCPPCTPWWSCYLQGTGECPVLAVSGEEDNNVLFTVHEIYYAMLTRLKQFDPW